MSKVKVGALATALTKELQKYSQVIADDLKSEVRQVAKDCAKEIKANSPENTGGYKKAWKATAAVENPTGIRIIVHNPDYYWLAHLLENGHTSPLTGVRVEGRPHIAPAAEKAVNTLEKKVKALVKK